MGIEPSTSCLLDRRSNHWAMEPLFTVHNHGLILFGEKNAKTELPSKWIPERERERELVYCVSLIVRSHIQTHAQSIQMARKSEADKMTVFGTN